MPLCRPVNFPTTKCVKGPRTVLRYPLPKNQQPSWKTIIRFVCLFVCNDQSFGPYIKGFAFIKYEKLKKKYFFVSFASSIKELWSTVCIENSIYTIYFTYFFSRYMWVEMKLHLHQTLSFALKLYLRFTVSVLRTTRGIQYDTLRHGIVFTALEKKNES